MAPTVQIALDRDTGTTATAPNLNARTKDRITWALIWITQGRLAQYPELRDPRTAPSVPDIKAVLAPGYRLAPAASPRKKSSKKCKVRNRVVTVATAWPREAGDETNTEINDRELPPNAVVEKYSAINFVRPTNITNNGTNIGIYIFRFSRFLIEVGEDFDVKKGFRYIVLYVV